VRADIESVDRRMKWWLLAVSLATLGLLVLAALAENVYPEWRQTRLAYARILEREATDARGQAIAAQFSVEPDQHVLPELRRVDRCVTCHAGIEDPRLANEKHPFRAHPGNILASHPPKKFGCTICHQGQGQATVLPDAHGHVRFWAEPMIPTRYAYASCGACHTALRVPGLAELQRGQKLIERHDCLACHRIDGRGGTLRPGGAGGMEGPNLSHVGTAGFDAQWYEKHLKQSEQAIDGPWKTAFGPIEPDARKSIETYLASRVGAPRLVEAKALFHTLGCRGCHKIGGVGGDDGLDLTHTGEKDPARLNFTHVSGERTVAQWHAEHLRDPAKIVPGSKMPKLGLSEEQVDLLTLYLLSLRRKDLPESYVPKDRILAERLGEREFATDGATLFGTFCAGCHGPSGEGQWFPGATPFPAVGNADFLAVASNQFLAETIRRGRPGRRMPAWDAKSGGLRAEEIDEIIAHLRRLGGTPRVFDGREPQTSQATPFAKPQGVPPSPLSAKPQGVPGSQEHPQRRWVKADAEAGRQLFLRACSFCHGQQGEGVMAPALNNPALQSAATDDYFIETIGRGRRGTMMQGFRNPSPVHPTLSEDEIHAIVAHLRTWETKP